MSIVLVACKIRRGAFSGERVFSLTMIGGDGEYVGVAPEDCFFGDRFQFVPQPESETYGLVEAILISRDDSSSKVRFPDGEFVDIPADLIKYAYARPKLAIVPYQD